MNPNPTTQTVAFGGGCFWCTEAVFNELAGITAVTSGYAGGTTENPTYEEVCSGRTGHAEVVQVEYDPSQVSFQELLTVFFATHDPTTLNRQGADIGTQYRSVIFYTTDEQRQEAENFIADLNASHSKGDPVVTEVKPLTHFYSAETYHQDYYQENPGNPYCAVVINPKLQKVQAQFAELLKRN
jgi:peptide-methionine (S)-S-oxide reductase